MYHEIKKQAALAAQELIEKAGLTAHQAFKHPVAVEEIKADAGLDIGDTLIGMHLKRIAVPVRLTNKTIGEARVTAARVRPKFIGGVRAHYDDSLL